MKQGGVLGTYCSHAYPHTSDLVQQLLPRALKGSDLVLYSVLMTPVHDIHIHRILWKFIQLSNFVKISLNGGRENKLKILCPSTALDKERTYFMEYTTRFRSNESLAHERRFV